MLLLMIRNDFYVAELRDFITFVSNITHAVAAVRSLSNKMCQ